MHVFLLFAAIGAYKMWVTCFRPYGLHHPDIQKWEDREEDLLDQYYTAWRNANW